MGDQIFSTKISSITEIKQARCFSEKLEKFGFKKGEKYYCKKIYAQYLRKGDIELYNPELMRVYLKDSLLLFKIFKLEKFLNFFKLL